jgi:hypothetical protein
MKILELLEVEKSPKSSRAIKHGVGRTTALIERKPIKNQIIRQLQAMLTAEGNEISKFINDDQISLAGCIVQVAHQTEDYEPTDVVASLAQCILSRYELSKALL